MRRLLVYLGGIVGVLLLAVIGLAGWIRTSGLPHYPVARIDVTIAPTPERIAHGRDLARMLCASCHFNPATRSLAGKRMADVTPQFGVIYAPNITRHPERGIGQWTDGELLSLLRTGIRRDGRYTPPFMVKLPRASDEDLASIIAFLRSDDPLVAPSDVATPPSEFGFLTKLLSRVAWSPLPYPQAPIVAPDTADAMARGRYLANDLLDCYACHSSDFTRLDVLQPERSAGFYEGGNTLLDAGGREIFSTNLTPDPETGIGAWTEEQFVRALTGGLRPDGSTILYPMQPYAALTDADARAIYTYLRSLAPVVKSRPPSPAHEVARAESAGQKTYNERGCPSCHGPAGVGLYDLRGATRRYPTNEDLARFIRNPGAQVPGIAMPAFGGVIPDAELPGLIAYVRALQVESGSR